MAASRPLIQLLNGVDCYQLCFFAIKLIIWIANVALRSQLSFSMLLLLQTPIKLAYSTVA
jgi:hypothetical protein